MCLPWRGEHGAKGRTGSRGEGGMKGGVRWGLCTEERRRAGKPRMLQAPHTMPAGFSTALGPGSWSPGVAWRCFLPILPAGIRIPLQHKCSLYAPEPFNAAGPGLQAAVSESTL